MSEAVAGPRFATVALHAGGPLPAPPDPAVSLTRSADPTVGRFEERLAALEGGSAAVAFAGGAGCLAAVLSAILRPGEELLASRRLADGELRTIVDAAGAGRWTMLAADADDPVGLARLVSPRSQALIVESVDHEDGRVSDLSAIAEVARRAQVPLIVDNTTATPALCRPLAFGADVVLHLSGARLGGPAALGVLIDGGSFDWRQGGRYPLLGEPLAAMGGQSLSDLAANFELAAGARLRAQGGIGALLGGGDGRAALEGLETLELRMRRQAASATAIAAFLAGHGEVAWVAHRGLLGDRYFNLAQRYCPAGAVPIVTFRPKGEGAAVRLLSRLRLFPGEGAGNASGARLAEGGGEAAAGVVRLAIGLEDAADLIADLEHALG